MIENNRLSKKQEDEMKVNKLETTLEKIIESIFFISACVAIISVVVITIFIFAKGGPAIFKIGIKEFIFGQEWNPTGDIYGIFPMIIGTLYSTIGAIIIGVPIGLFTAVFIAEVAPKWISNIVRPAVELLAGIPSVVYGFFGLIVIVPLIDKYLGGGGNSLLATCIILGIMILPTIISISETSIRSVPKTYKAASLAMGASHIQTIFKVILPSAKSGIMTSVVLGIGRAIGETMAVILVAGNTPTIPNSLLDRVRPMTANIAIEMGYASGLHQEALFATGVVLFIFIMGLNIALNTVIHKAGEK
ncbi:phosphate ABC transporter permease protein PstC [Gottschalkia acidurici 9a]|uniref:Phosphate transport system permease protein n=1 Tax=Gottschalkia acidurici (strain ATCC 7906 / DSM 604 / BCRC 14475 / CIP 104303 / KCTC 5404 / NCIMB 10678 / 9a) TaxID=1128398 RepID=K0B0X3_GOTA9|nr:phosphate ABC transporter permease subunit PstC [Gottschalkia acidurici]AFS78296.1 phosphate ABC transporter permease protein PstC [Gottschalkia acidurici 9a]